MSVLGAYVVGASFGQYRETHETPLPLIGVFTGKAGLSERHLKEQNQNALGRSRGPPETEPGWTSNAVLQTYQDGTVVVYRHMSLTYQLCKQFFWGHVERHGVNNLEHRKKRNLSNDLTAPSLRGGLAAATVRGLLINRNPHLSGAVFGIVVLCAVAVIVFLVLRVLLARRGLCNQQREDGLQDGVQQLLLQYGLQIREQPKYVCFIYFPVDQRLSDEHKHGYGALLRHLLQTLAAIISICVTVSDGRL